MRDGGGVTPEGGRNRGEGGVKAREAEGKWVRLPKWRRIAKQNKKCNDNFSLWERSKSGDKQIITSYTRLVHQNDHNFLGNSVLNKDRLDGNDSHTA